MKIVIKITLISFLAVLNLDSYAQDFRDNNELIQHLNSQSGMLTVKLVPGAKTIKVYVIGTEAAKVEFDKLGVEASIIVAGTSHKVKVSRDKDHFNILRTTEKPLKLDLKIDGPDKANTLRFDVP